MIKKSTTISLLLFFSFLLLQCEESPDDKAITKKIVTEAMVLEQKRLCVNPYEKESIEENTKAFMDTTNVEDVKKQLKRNYKYYINNKEEIIEELETYEKSQEDRFLSNTRLYLSDEEQFEEKENVYQELVNNNHVNYRDTTQSGPYFDQIFENNKSSLKNRVRNNGAFVFKFGNEEAIPPYYSLNFDSEQELKIMNIYYHDGTVDSRETSIPEYAFPLNSIPVDRMKHVDSLQMEFKVMYVSAIDSVHFNKSEIGVKKGGFKLLRVENNYVEYETPNDHYPYHKGSILEEVYFNRNGEVLETDYSLGNIGLQTAEEHYNKLLNVSREYYEYVTIATTKEEVGNALQYVQLKYYNDDLKETKKERVLLKGNIESFTIYQEVRRDTITFLATLKNANNVKNVNVHRLEEETEFIDQNGKRITSLPFSIHFLYSSRTDLESDRYFVKDTESYYDGHDNEYYFIDQEEQVILELSYSEVDFLCQSIMIVREDDVEGFKLLSTENRLLFDKTFDSSGQRYEDKGIVVYNDEGAFLLLDQNDEIITPDTQIVTKVILKKID